MKQIIAAVMWALAMLLMEAQSKNAKEDTEGKLVEWLADDVSSVHRLYHCWNLLAQRWWWVIEKANSSSKEIWIGLWVVCVNMVEVRRKKPLINSGAEST